MFNYMQKILNTTSALCEKSNSAEKPVVVVVSEPSKDLSPLKLDPTVLTEKGITVEFITADKLIKSQGACLRGCTLVSVIMDTASKNLLNADKSCVSIIQSAHCSLARATLSLNTRPESLIEEF